MFRFFRSIRQQLLAENKTVRYLKYAVGEVLLIMIGIFLALQLNNWNERRLDRIEEAEILAGLEREFEAYYRNFSIGQEDRYPSILSSMEDILRAINNGEWVSEEGTFDEALSWTLIAPTADHGGGVLDALIQSGRLELVQDGTLREKLAKWSGVLAELQGEQQSSRKYMLENIWPYLSKGGFQLSEVRSTMWATWPVNTVSIDFDKAEEQRLLSDPEFRSQIELRYSEERYIATVAHKRVFDHAADILEHIQRIRSELNN